MLTIGETGANTPRLVMMSVAELARRDGVSKPTISNKVKRLVEQHGLQVERDGRGRVSAVNVAHYDDLLEHYANPLKSQAPERAEQRDLALKQSESVDEAVRQKTWYEVERRKIELERQKGNLVEAARITDAAVSCAARITRIVDRLPSYADDLATAVAKDGSPGARAELKALANRMRTEIADALSGIAGATTETDNEAMETE